MVDELRRLLFKRMSHYTVVKEPSRALAIIAINVNHNKLSPISDSFATSILLITFNLRIVKDQTGLRRRTRNCIECHYESRILT